MFDPKRWTKKLTKADQLAIKQLRAKRKAEWAATEALLTATRMAKMLKRRSRPTRP